MYEAPLKATAADKCKFPAGVLWMCGWLFHFVFWRQCEQIYAILKHKMYMNNIQNANNTINKIIFVIILL